MISYQLPERLQMMINQDFLNFNQELHKRLR